VRGIGFANRHDLPPSVKGGGHNVAGNAVCDGGLVLDLFPIAIFLGFALQATALSVGEPCRWCS
jgi:FAD/FMN-containing dehydrogenase